MCINIRETFLSLTSITAPYGTEDQVVKRFPFKIKNLQRDKHGNHFVKIGKSRSIFTCHLDTACGYIKPVNHVIKGDMVYTDGTTILGADDKAGTTILLNMISENIPGLYFFFAGEERGCQGSSPVAKERAWGEDYDRMISFDRRRYGSVITNQMGGTCCSDEFAKALSHELTELGIPSRPDPTGIYTDSAQFTGIIPECTNLSVGYEHEHHTSECQDLAYLEKLANISLKVKWEELPVIGAPKGYSRGWWSDWDY